MRKNLILTALVLPAFLLWTAAAHATSYIVWDTEIAVYAQSAKESGAHCIRLSKPMHNGGAHAWCGDRAHILISDKEPFTTALATSISGKSVNVLYEDASESQVVDGHISFT
jgi:hypothetical protein